MAEDDKDKSKPADPRQANPQPAGAQAAGKLAVARKRDEDPVGKVYDSRLMRRLGHYLRPYWVQATISTLAVSLKSLSDVVGPYLVKVAIDRYLTGTPGPATNWFTRLLPADGYHGITVLAAIYLGALLSAYLLRVHPDLHDAVARPEDHVRPAPRHLPPHAAHAHRLL
jgi:ATP-binding cassette subfamily B multidrug efflux pump